MDDQIQQSTLSSRKFASFYFIKQNNSNGDKSKWCLFITALLTNILLPGLVLSYGIVASVRRSTHHPVSELLITPCVFHSVWMLTESWFYDAADIQRFSRKVKTITFAGLLICFIGVLCNAWTDNIYNHVIFYGVFGGLGTSVVMSQVNYVIEDNICQSDLRKLRMVCLYGQALSQCLLPSLFMVVFYFYGHLMAYLPLSGAILQALPFTLCLKIYNHNHNKMSDPQIATYQRAYSLFDDETSSCGSALDFPLADLSKKSWKNPSDESLHLNNNNNYISYTVDDDDSEDGLQFDCELNEQDKLKTLQGVEILPRIVEESEEIETDDEKITTGRPPADEPKIVEKGIKRLSALSNAFDDVIVNDTSTSQNSTKISNIAEHSPNVTPLSKSRDEWLRNKRPNTSMRVSNHFWYRYSRMFKNFPKFMSSNLIRPIKTSLKTWQFYPVIMLKISSSLLMACFSTLISIVDYSNKSSELNTLSLSNITLIISMHGILWLSFLVFSGWINNLKKSKFKMVSSLGCIVSSLGLLVISEYSKMELVLLGSALTGIGFGAISISSQDTSRDLIGLRKWIKIKRTLDSMSAIVVLVVMLWLSYLLTLNTGVESCFQVLSSLVFISGLMWTIIVFIELMKKHEQNDPINWPHM